MTARTFVNLGIRRWIAGIAIGAALIPAGAIPAAATSPTRQPSPGHLAFTGDGTLTVLNPDGSDRRVVYRPAESSSLSSPLSSTAGASSPAWAPDGKHLAFIGPGAAGLAVMFNVGADGRGLRKITALPARFLSGPSWSPDSKRVTFSTVDTDLLGFFGPPSGGSALWTINRDGSGLTLVLAQPGYILNPAWSPDGKQIALSSQPTGNGSPSLVEVVPFSGGVPTVVSPLDRFADLPSWAPDSSTIAFNVGSVLYVTPQEEVWLVRRDGANPHPLVCRPACDKNGYERASWSPDGHWLVIPQYSHESALVVHPDGSGGRWIHPVPVVDPYADSDEIMVSPTWSPDSRRLAFIAGNHNLSAVTDLVELDLQTGSHRLIANVSNNYKYYAQIDWSRR